MAKKTAKTSIPNKGEIVIYHSQGGKAVMDVRLDGGTLAQSQMDGRAVRTGQVLCFQAFGRHL
ncbi:MAG: hypothetical protein KKB20_04370 [Proteobacteria bacterium]|nr:hypothetical protein [Pseudomonadota bacterium]